MPTYEYECEEGHLTEEVRPIGCRHEAGSCEVCGRATSKILSVPKNCLIGMQYEHPGGVYDPQLGMVVNSKAHLREICKRNGYTIRDPSERNQFTGEKRPGRKPKINLEPGMIMPGEN